MEPVGYESALNDAAAIWGNNRGEATEWARSALTALMQGSMSPSELACSVYEIVKPLDAWGRRTSPKMRHGKMSVRNLENHAKPVVGAAAARSCLEAVLLIYENRELVRNELEAFLRGNGKLYGLRKLVKHAVEQSPASETAK